VAVGEGFGLRVGLAGAVDLAAESARISKEVARVEADLAGIERKLANPSFVERAPADVVQRERDRLAAEQAARVKLMESLGWLTDSDHV
jgi:valyl-tRNA synthetase